MQKQAQQPSRGKQEKGPLVQIKLGLGKASEVTSAVEGGAVRKVGFKKGGFKSAFGSIDDDEQVESKTEEDVGIEEMKAKLAQDDDSDLTNEEDYYDPSQPTGCMPGCKSRVRSAVD